MKDRIIVAAICLPILFIILFFLPSYIFTALIAIICAISAYELQTAIGSNGNIKNVDLHSQNARVKQVIGSRGEIRISIYAVFSAALIPIGAYFEEFDDLIFIAVFLVLMSLMFIEAIIVFRSKRQISFTRILITLFAGTLIPLMLSSLVSLKNMREGRLLVLLPVISAFITDGGAYFTGMFFGKRSAFPLISPKKTVEGCIGGLLAGTAAMVIYGVILLYTTNYGIVFWAFILYGLIGGILTELGDLAFSLIKREYDIKDYGRLLPGHGGMLDRFDSMVFTAPAMLLLTSVIPAIIIRNS